MNQSGGVVARHDYTPYGEEIAAGTAGRNASFGLAGDSAQKFTGQVRDPQTGMDYFNARYLAPAVMQFTSPDPGQAGARMDDPQSWNGYAYVRGNPLGAVDPSGMGTFFGGGGGGDDPCWDDPFFCYGGDWFPPPFWGSPSSGPEPAPPTQTEGEASGGWPKGSFPNGETLGLPTGMRVPGPFGIGLPDPFVWSIATDKIRAGLVTTQGHSTGSERWDFLATSFQVVVRHGECTIKTVLKEWISFGRADFRTPCVTRAPRVNRVVPLTLQPRQRLSNSSLTVKRRPLACKSVAMAVAGIR